MAKVSSAQLERQLNEAFESFREALQGMLEQEAQSSVQRALARMAQEDSPFSVSDAQVEVVVTGLTVAAGQPSSASPSAARPRTSRRPGTRKATGSARKRGARSPRRGGVREALLASFENPKAELTIEDLTGKLHEQGVQSTTNNLHQQLRRLVQSGELTRAGRGVYKRA